MKFHEQPRNWALTLTVLFVFFLGACGDSTSLDDAKIRAMQLREQGKPEAAVIALREAIRSDPDDPTIRLLLAEIYLDLGQGALAATALDQALDRGLLPALAVVPRARAYYAQRRFRELIELPVPVELSVGRRARLFQLQADARSAQSISKDGFDEKVTRAYLELFDFVAGHSNSAEVVKVARSLQETRSRSFEVERAWEHHDCANNKSTAFGWQPLERNTGRVIRVGPGRELTTMAAAAALAKDGDTVEIDPGIYEAGIALWPQNRLLVRGAGVRPMITASGQSIQDRDVWLFTGDDVVVENVEISGARSKYENGAAIRHMGAGLTLRHVNLHDNENGVLTSNRYPGTNSVLIEYSEFANNGDGRGQAHNIYIGRAKRFELRFSWSRGSRGGHLVKSRAQHNLIEYNQLTDGEEGETSYIIDIPEGGKTIILGNVIEQGPVEL